MIKTTKERTVNKKQKNKKVTVEKKEPQIPSGEGIEIKIPGLNNLLSDLMNGNKTSRRK